VNTTEVARGAAISVRQAIAMNTPKAVELWLDVVDDPTERARQLARLSPADLRRVGELLDMQTAAKVFHSVDVPLGAKMLKALPNSRVDELLAAINSHRAAAILRHVDAVPGTPCSPRCRSNGRTYCAAHCPGPPIRSRHTPCPRRLRSARR
jgi:hypothetical protein